MPRRGGTKGRKDPLNQYRKTIEEEREARFHEAAEKEDPYDWNKRPSSPESRNKRTKRKLATTGQKIKDRETTGDDRTKFRTRNGVTWRTVKTKEEIEAEEQAALEKELARQKRSYEHKNDKGRPAFTRYVIKLNVVGYPKPYYYGGDEIGWTTYECAVQYLGKKKSEQMAMRLIKELGLNDKTDRFDSIEVLSIPKECNKEWLYSENISGVIGRGYEEEEYDFETHEEFVERRKKENEERPEIDCESCLCNDCSRRNPLCKHNICDECLKCKKGQKKERWRDECEKYIKARSKVRRLLL